MLNFAPHPSCLIACAVNKFFTNIKELNIIKLPVHSAQGLSYMKLLQKPKGLLINFHTDNVAGAYKPFVNDIFAGLHAD